MEATSKPRPFSEILRTEHLVLVDFSAEWCGLVK